MPLPPSFIEKKENIKNIIGGWSEIDKAIAAYIVSFIILFFVIIFFFKKNIYISFIFSLILSHLFLTFIFVPYKYNIFCELTNSNLFYIFIQSISPVIIYIFAIYKCF